MYVCHKWLATSVGVYGKVDINLIIHSVRICFGLSLHSQTRLFYFLNLRTRFYTCARIYVTMKATNRFVDRAHSVKGCPIWLPTPRLSGHVRARMHMHHKFPCTFLDWVEILSRQSCLSTVLMKFRSVLYSTYNIGIEVFYSKCPNTFISHTNRIHSIYRLS